MRKFVAFIVAALLATAASAQTVVNQGSGANTGTAAWRVLSANPIVNGAPAARVAISAVSAAATGLTAGARYRVACDTACFFRTGTGTPTAVTTDAAFYGPAVEYLTLRAGDTAIAFITTAGTGVCTISRLLP